jgi:mannose-6-phosphate isomerase-like protein (cupin superfamily)
MKPALVLSVVVVLAGSEVSAQVGGRGSGSAAPKPSRSMPVRVMVRDTTGASLDRVRITLSGDQSGEFTTAGAGLVILPNLKDGTYRVRCERDGYITLEREFSLRSGDPGSIEIALNPEPPAPPPPPPAPEPAKPMPVSGPPVSLSVIDFLEHNFVGRDPLKESVVACTPYETVRLLQMRQPVASHAHADVDELVYVVAGEGSAQLGQQTVPLKPGTMVLIPRASLHAFERRGSNPLMIISTLAGAPCHESGETR